MDDQVVPLYSALNISASHPSILRAIFCDGAAFPRVDFLTNLLSFCASVRNAGLSDHNLLTLLSASVAGSLYGGAGHSIVYEESSCYSLAVRYLLEVTSITSYPTTKTNESQVPRLIFEPFSTMENAKWNSNPFALPWSLRGLLEDPLVRKYFDPTIDKLLKDYNDWAPVTKTLKDGKFLRFTSTIKVEPFKSAYLPKDLSLFFLLIGNSAIPSRTNATRLKAIVAFYKYYRYCCCYSLYLKAMNSARNLIFFFSFYTQINVPFFP